MLYPNVLRDVLIRLAQTGLVHARWTDRILDETFRNLAADRPEIPAETLARLRELMNRAVPDCLVTGYEATHPGPDAARRGRPACARRGNSLQSVGDRHREPAQLPDTERAQFGIGDPVELPWLASIIGSPALHAE